jgi:CDP-diacylglycerol--glycerol-3-phosphate 3-phosphatidyltransferase
MDLGRFRIMLDTHARKYADGIFDHTARVLLTLKLTPTQVTLVALIVGLVAALQYYIGHEMLAIALLWFSGYLDAVDGAMARKSKKTTNVGTLLDIFFDRVVELSFVMSFAFRHESALLALLCLTCAIVLSMSVFLTSGMLIENSGKKSFHYQAGLMERTEGFLMFTLMMIFNQHIVILTFLYAGLIIFTVIQRLLESIKLLEE